MVKELERRIVGIFNADFGAEYGFGVDEYYRFKELSKKKYVHSLIYRDFATDNFEFDYNLVRKALPLGNKIPKILSGIEFFSKERLQTSLLTKKLFDKFAASKIPKISNGVLFTYPDYVNCIKYAKSLGYKIVLATSSHPKWIMNTAKKEYKTFNIPIHSAYNPDIFKRQLQSLTYADYFITVTEFSKKTLIDEGFDENKIFVNPNGVSDKNFEKYSSPQIDTMKFLFVANITLMKGLQYLLEAWNNLNIRDSQLIICGSCSPEFRKILDTYLAKNKNIKYEGQVSNPFDYYKKSSVFILPSLIEGMPRVVTEAMANGKPVIVTPIASSIIKNGQEGIIINPRDVKSIEKAIMYFYQQKSECNRMGKIAYETSKKLTWNNHSNQMVNIFEKIMKIENVMHNEKNQN